MNLRRLLLCALTLPLLSLGGCPQPQPGIELGRYLVVATRTGGTCGPQQEEGAYSFQVDITLRPGVVRWAQTVGSPTDGTYDHGSRAFRLTMEQSRVLAQSNRAAEYPGCVIVRADAIDARFQGEVPDPSRTDGGSAQGPAFVGTYTILWSGSAGSDCSPFVGATSQQWAALPCTTTYRLDGTRQ